jgi:hypothetical protein
MHTNQVAVAFSATRLAAKAVLNGDLSTYRAGSAVACLAMGTKGRVRLTLEQLTEQETETLVGAVAAAKPFTILEAGKLIACLYAAPLASGSDRPIIPAHGQVFLACAGNDISICKEVSRVYASRVAQATNSADLAPLARLFLIRCLGALPVSKRYACPKWLAAQARFED